MAALMVTCHASPKCNEATLQKRPLTPMMSCYLTRTTILTSVIVVLLHLTIIPLLHCMIAVTNTSDYDSDSLLLSHDIAITKTSDKFDARLLRFFRCVKQSVLS